ncbi:NmrA-like family protein [Colletotrichum truncatum]|uniref:NmrA-like family protein n=1 Tax=Colletotrichum truncatum TaxID=5467 RepID=A0ACC3ZCN9_COLTU|nr:NmrA-like family protein [Colletotrichum truncatum]KAF6782251.1 NmrA-like family protein [Colletotrichum truncatum]
MAGKKIIVVFGATGAQGGGVVKTFLNDPVLKSDWTVRAVTRDPSKESAKKLEQQGAEVVSANLDDKASLLKVLNGATAAFAVTNYWEKVNMESEIQQGKNVVNAAKNLLIHDIILFTKSHTKPRAVTNGKLPHVYHFDGKAEVEKYAREVGVPATFFLPGIYMDNITNQMFRFNPEHDTWVMAAPLPETAQIPLFDPANTGIWVKAIIRKRDQLLGKRVFGATKYSTPTEIVEDFRQTFPEAGKTVSFFQLPDEMFRQAAKDAMGVPDWLAQGILENMKVIYEGGYYGFKSLDESLAILEDKPTQWVDFMKKSPVFEDLK